MATRVKDNIIFHCRIVGSMNNNRALEGLAHRVFRHIGITAVATKVEVDRVSTQSTLLAEPPDFDTLDEMLYRRTDGRRSVKNPKMSSMQWARVGPPFEKDIP